MSPSLFTAEINEMKILHNILRAISFQEFAVLTPLEEGLKIKVDDSNCCETSVYIPDEVFSSYHVAKNEEIKFKVSLKVLTECLHIYGDEGSPVLKLNYRGAGSPLGLVIKHSEENITVDCQLNTFEVENVQDVVLSEACNLNNIIFNGELFMNVLSDLDMSSDDFQLEICVDPPLFRITTTSVLGESVMDVSKHSDMIALYQIKTDFKAKYAFSNIRQIMKVMGYAKNISISTGESGLLGIQLNVNSSSKDIFVEYYVTALFGEED